MEGTTNLTFVHGPVRGELGYVTAGNYTAYPFNLPSPYFTEDRRSGTATHTTDGVAMLTDLVGDYRQPVLVRSSFALFCALLISPQGLKVREIRSLTQVVATDGRLVLRLEASRFGLPADSAIVFAGRYANSLTFHRRDELSADLEPEIR